MRSYASCTTFKVATCNSVVRLKFAMNFCIICCRAADVQSKDDHDDIVEGTRKVQWTVVMYICVIGVYDYWHLNHMISTLEI